MFRQWFSGRKSVVATVTSGSVVAVLVTTVALLSGGYSAQRMDLNDSSVWVANGSRQVIGRANIEIGQLNTVVASTGSEIDVIQRGATVLLFDQTDSKIDIVDPATSTLQSSVPLPPQNPRVFLAGDNVVIAATTTGQVWILPLAELSHFDAQSQPTLSLGANSAVSVAPDGTLYGFSSAARQVYRVNAAGPGGVPETHSADFGDASGTTTITSVGDHWALLDTASRVLDLDGREFDLSTLIGVGQNPVLQQSASQGDRILVGYDGGVVALPVGGGTPAAIVTGQSGFAAAPASVDGCLYAAWSGGTAWRQCAGGGEGTLLRLDSVPSAAVRLSFQHNGDRVVLNDPRGGGSWAVQQSGALIDNWDELIVVKNDQQRAETNNEDTPPVFEKDQVPPVAVNDSFGARPGRSSVLPVLLNDYDPNGDMLVISEVTPINEAIGRLDLINDRQQIQISLNPAATGSISFRYTITDGRGGTANATVTVAVRALSENSPPRQVRQTRASLAQGGRVTTAVLGDWVDPDGDPFYLTSASTAAPDIVSFKPEGTVVFVEGGVSSQLRSVSLVVSDGRAEGTGSMRVTVKKPGEVPIVADPFVVLTSAGRQVTVHPLDHVRGGTGTLRLSSVPEKTGSTITPSLETGTFRFTSDQIGTHYLDYVVNDGEQTVTGVVRIDVVVPPDVNSKPITIPKTVFVKTLGSQTIDVAATDIDPAGGVLMVTGVSAIPSNSGVRAEVLEQRTIRVTLTAPLDVGPVIFHYRISNGLAEADGVVTVIEIPRPARLQPPIATDDAVTVRVGDAIDIPVLANDAQPDGGDLTLNPQLSTTLSGDSGLLFASGNVLRYLAPAHTGNFVATYEVSGPDGQIAQANLRIAVREAVLETNNPPVPPTVTARVLAAGVVRIKIPLAGTDPDGDSVQLLGQETNPQKGSVTTVGPDYIDYEAGGYSAGTDSFTYTVMDALGARATGTVRVGLSAKLEGVRNPVAVEDEVRVRPGRTVSVQVLANDSDPDGSPLTVVSVVPNGQTVVAKIVNNFVRVTPPTITGRYGLVYTIENAFGGTSSSFLTVVVDPAAPRAYPIASDTVLTLTDILGRDSLDVNVLSNVFFADGAVSELTVSLLRGYESSATVTGDKRIRVTVGKKSQIIPFAVAHPDDASVVSYAFVWVPGYDDALPQINRTARPLTVASESSLTIDLNDYVIAIGGKRVRLTDTSTVQATHANGDSLIGNDQTLRFRSADKYFGPASISFEVTDGSSGTDPAGRTATLVLPIKVTPRQNQPPAFNGGMIDFEPGQQKDLDLLKLTTYPYPNDLVELAYTVLGQLPVGFSYTLTGQKLSLKADADVPKNTVSAIVIGVHDALTDGKAGRIQLTVVASSRPLAKAAADTAIVPRGQTTVVDVLANDEATNPFPGQPLQVVSVRGIGALPAGVTIVPNADNSKLSVTVGKDAPPVDVNLQYQVMDATRDADRAVWGAATLQVQDVPDPVTGIQVTGFSDRQLTIAWSPGGFNNSPITGYEVTATRSDTGQVFGTTACAVTSGCDIQTPGNGSEGGLRISVIAKNAIGNSKPASLVSAVWSDILPAAPTITSVVPTNSAPAGGAISVAWSAPDPILGSAVTGYTVRIVGGGVDWSVALGLVTSLPDTTAAGQLVPNALYQVTVFARNQAQVVSESAWRRSETRSVTTVGPPSRTAGGVSATSGTDGKIQVTWGVSGTNGASSISYYVTRFVAGVAVPTSCPASSPSGSGVATSSPWIDNGAADGTSYFYVVSADNGLYCTPTASGPVQSLAAPGPASGTAIVQAHGDSGQFDIRAVGDFSVTPGTAAKYQYQLNGGGWADVPAERWLTSAADSSVYGKEITVAFRGCRDASDNYCGPASTPMPLTPVNTRAAVTSCLGDQPPVVIAAPNNNGATATVSYKVSYNQPTIVDVWSSWSDYSASASAPVGATQIRVRATVEIDPGLKYIDPGYGEGPCTW